ncbi:hypothetical protein ACFPK9_09485 [Rubritalea spongiae]|uniref:hypothetical protein n=1 Tax=Rubritalea spongiae TaxID=430797 RepID=UPI00360E7A00
MKKSLLTGLICASVMLLCQCGHKINVREEQKPVDPIELSKKAPVSEAERKLFDSLVDEMNAARKLERRDTRRAIGIYLDVAHQAYSYEDAEFLPIYNHAVGQIADLFVELGGVDTLAFQGGGGCISCV